MSFAIKRSWKDGLPVIRLEGKFVGWAAWKTLSGQLAAALSAGGPVVVDVAALTAYDDACLAAIDAGVDTWLVLEGCAEFLWTQLTGGGTS